MGHCQFFDTLDALKSYLGVVHDPHQAQARWKEEAQALRSVVPERIVLSRLESVVSGSSWTCQRSCAGSFVHRSSSSKSLAWKATPHPTSGAVCGCHRSCGFYRLQRQRVPLRSARTTLEEGHAPSQSRCWPWPSYLCGAWERSMINTNVKASVASTVFRYNQLACLSRCLLRITLLLPLRFKLFGWTIVFWIGLSESGISRVSAGSLLWWLQFLGRSASRQSIGLHNI